MVQVLLGNGGQVVEVIRIDERPGMTTVVGSSTAGRLSQ